MSTFVPRFFMKLGHSMRRELLLFREMIDAAARILEVVGDLDADSLHVDELRLESVLWNFTVLGEAAAQMPDEVKPESVVGDAR